MEENKNLAMVSSTLKSLEDKISALNLAISDIKEEEILSKAKDIKQKTVDVLNKAYEKINNANDDAIESEDFIHAVRVVKNKSEILFNDAIKKIDIIKKESELQKLIKESKEKVEEEIKEEVIEEPSISTKAKEILLSWLKEDGN